ncbi:MAG: phosphotransferase, partial [Loktanella sp.]|nr:phosphotransferase [Loktanella sp.]
MKYAFRTQAEALIHGDLHSGSVMVTANDTRIIDPEWAFVGPMGFDIGALLGNLLLSYFSQPGHARSGADRQRQSDYLLQTIVSIWTAFDTGFRHLCRTEAGTMLNAPLLDRAEQDAFLDRYLAGVFCDTLGFAGAKMIRRIIGISHVADFEMIADIPLRATCEGRALDLARLLLLDRRGITDINDVAAMARDIAAKP